MDIVVVQSLSHVQPHGLWHTRLLCPPLSPGVCLDSYPLSQWCYLTISSSVPHFYSSHQSFPAPGSFPMSWFFALAGQNIGVSASASVLPMNIQDWSLLGWTGWISLQSKGLSRVFYNTTVQKHQFFGSQLSFSHVTILKFLIIFEQGSCSTLYWSPQKYVANPRKISGLIFSNSQSINFSLKFSHLWAIKFLY